MHLLDLATIDACDKNRCIFAQHILPVLFAKLQQFNQIMRLEERSRAISEHCLPSPTQSKFHMSTEAAPFVPLLHKLMIDLYFLEFKSIGFSLLYLFTFLTYG